MLPDMTHIILGLIYYDIQESLAVPFLQIQRLMVWMAYDQDIKIYAPLMHKQPGFAGQIVQCCYLTNSNHNI